MRGWLCVPGQKPGPKVRENPFAAVAQELFAAETKQKYESRPEAAQTDGNSGGRKTAPKKGSKKKKSTKKKKP